VYRILCIRRFSSHPYPEHPHRTGQNSQYLHGTSGCIPPTGGAV